MVFGGFACLGYRSKGANFEDLRELFYMALFVGGRPVNVGNVQQPPPAF